MSDMGGDCFLRLQPGKENHAKENAPMRKTSTIKISLNSPVVLTFAAICVLALVLSSVTGGRTDWLVFSVYRSSLTDPFTYLRFFCHIFGHASVSHLLNNMMMILVLGPMLEEKYGSRSLILVILITALVTGLIHFIFFPHVMLMGASGVVFAFILLASFTNVREREIPLTFLLVAILYLGNQIYEGIVASDNVSQLTHIVGGIVGAAMGYLGVRHRR